MSKDKPGKLPLRKGAGIVLVNDQGLIWAGMRNDTPDAWQMPQGGIDEGETPKQAALRELWEETGVSSDLVEVVARSEGWVKYDLPKELLGKVWGGKYRGQKQKWFLLRFRGEDSQINIQTEHPEFSVWAWKTADEVLASIVPFKKDIYDQVISEFREFVK